MPALVNKFNRICIKHSKWHCASAHQVALHFHFIWGPVVIFFRQVSSLYNRIFPDLFYPICLCFIYLHLRLSWPASIDQILLLGFWAQGNSGFRALKFICSWSTFVSVLRNLKLCSPSWWWRLKQTAPFPGVNYLLLFTTQASDAAEDSKISDKQEADKIVWSLLSSLGSHETKIPKTAKMWRRWFQTNGWPSGGDIRRWCTALKNYSASLQGIKLWRADYSIGDKITSIVAIVFLLLRILYPCGFIFGYSPHLPTTRTKNLAISCENIARRYYLKQRHKCQILQECNWLHLRQLAMIAPQRTSAIIILPWTLLFWRLNKVPLEWRTYSCNGHSIRPLWRCWTDSIPKWQRLRWRRNNG